MGFELPPPPTLLADASTNYAIIIYVLTVNVSALNWFTEVCKVFASYFFIAVLSCG